MHGDPSDGFSPRDHESKRASSSCLREGGSMTSKSVCCCLWGNRVILLPAVGFCGHSGHESSPDIVLSAPVPSGLMGSRVAARCRRSRNWSQRSTTQASSSPASLRTGRSPCDLLTLHQSQIEARAVSSASPLLRDGALLKRARPPGPWRACRSRQDRWQSAQSHPSEWTRARRRDSRPRAFSRRRW